MDCVYLGSNISGTIHKCLLYETCDVEKTTPDHASCVACQDKLGIDDKDFAAKWVDPLEVCDRSKLKTDSLRNVLVGGDAFLVCGGPSINDMPLHLLKQRGVWIMAVNNVAAHHRIRPQAFVCSDPPMKFSNTIWDDPGVMKFVPTPKMSGRRAKLRRKIGKVFKESDRRVCDCPNVWGFKRESYLVPNDEFFMAAGAMWGNQDAGVDRTHEKKTVCTFLLGLRLLYYMGARRIFLLGVDFRMTPNYGYGFGQKRTPGASTSNNRHFVVVNDWLCRLQQGGTFDRFGLEIFNCFERSSLRAFPYVPLGFAVEGACNRVEQRPDLEGWYEKANCPECNSWNVRFGDECECLKCHHKWNPYDTDD